MSTLDTIRQLSEIKEIILLINNYVPVGSPKNDSFRAELAGLLIVSTVAIYENCIREIIIEYAEKKHPDFARYVEREYERLDSRIKLQDLFKYASKLGDSQLVSKFKSELMKASGRVSNDNTINIDNLEKSEIVKLYHQVLKARHAFAHARRKNINTIEEAYKFHCKARFIILSFSRALSIKK